jgi:hypothetical protein
MHTAAPGALRGYPYGGTAYANPDAVTSIGSTLVGYDNAGNATSSGSSSFTSDTNANFVEVGGITRNRRVTPALSDGWSKIFSAELGSVDRLARPG